MLSKHFKGLFSLRIILQTSSFRSRVEEILNVEIFLELFLIFKTSTQLIMFVLGPHAGGGQWGGGGVLLQYSKTITGLRSSYECRFLLTEENIADMRLVERSGLLLILV